jgi:hypothetical protein
MATIGPMCGLLPGGGLGRGSLLRFLRGSLFRLFLSNSLLPGGGLGHGSLLRFLRGFLLSCCLRRSSLLRSLCRLLLCLLFCRGALT